MTGTRLTIIPAFAFLVSVSLCEQVSAATWMPDSSWKAVDMSDLMVKNGSALDLSAMNDAPAGKHGRAVIGTGGFLAFEDDPMQPVKLMGSNCGFPDDLIGNVKDGKEFKARSRQFAKAYRNQGYNVMRLFTDSWFLSARNEDLKIRPERLDRLDFILAALKDEGIYVEHVLFSYSFFRSQVELESDTDNSFKLAMYLNDERTLARFRWAAQTLLNHVNPYTGLAWKDDPAVIHVEFFNELEFGLIRTANASSEMKTRLNIKFQQWLRGEYQSPAVLSTAWNDPSLKNFERVTAPADIQKATGQPGRDYVNFVFNLSQDCVARCEAAVRETGYKGLTAQYDLPYWWVGDCAVRYECSQVATAHNYYSHPSGTPLQKDNPWGSECHQRSSVAEEANYWCSTNSVRFPDRPFLVTEYNHAFWNQYQHEAGILFGAYSAFQGFDGLQVHCMPVPPLLKAGRCNSFTIGTSPVGRANEFLVSLLFRRGDVTRARHRIDLEIEREQVECLGGVSLDQSKIALMTGFAVTFPWAKRPQRVGVPGKPDIRIATAGASAVKIGAWAMELYNANGPDFPLNGFVNELKVKSILPAVNISDPAQGIYQNESGEITMRAKERLLKVVTPRTEAVTMDGGKGELLDCLQVVENSVPACIAACSVDGTPLKESKRVVLVFSTDTANTGMVLSEDRKKLARLGECPVLMKTGRLLLKLRNLTTTHLGLYALGFDGARREKLPLNAENGFLNIFIDTATLKHGPTPFFELAAE